MPQVNLTRDQLVVGNFYKTRSGYVYFVLHPEQEGVYRTTIRFEETSAGWAYECYATPTRAKSFEPYDGADIVKRMRDNCLVGLNRWLRNAGYQQFCPIFVKPAVKLNRIDRFKRLKERMKRA